LQILQLDTTYMKKQQLKRRRKNFATDALGEGYGSLTPEQRSVRAQWLADSKAREAQLVEIAGQALYGYADAGLADTVALLCKPRR
jgi:hypothetical protein